MLKTWGLPLDVIHPKEVELYKKDIAAVHSKETVDKKNVPPVQTQKRTPRTVAFSKPVKTNPGVKKFISMDERRLRKPVGRVKDIVEIFEDRSVCLFFFSGYGSGRTKVTGEIIFRSTER